MIISPPEAWTYILQKLRKFLSEDPRLNIKNIHGAGFQLIVREDPAEAVHVELQGEEAG
jgi:hypothetical protein